MLFPGLYCNGIIFILIPRASLVPLVLLAQLARMVLEVCEVMLDLSAALVNKVLLAHLDLLVRKVHLERLVLL